MPTGESEPESSPSPPPEVGTERVQTVAVPSNVKLGTSTPITPQQPTVHPIKSENTYVGYALAKIFAGILAGYTLIAVIATWCSEARMLSKMDALTQGVTVEKMASSGQAAEDGSTVTTRITKEDVEALTKSISEAYRDIRGATLEFHKTVIVNVLLPILTALLGYIFAKRERSESDQ
jgi:hypothetical protein